MSGHRHGYRDARGKFARAPEGWTGGRPRGPRRPQIVRHKNALTDEEIEIFLSALGETCNVRHSAREAGRPAQTFYRLRRRHSGFRAAWLEALDSGFDHLEMELLHRARFGTPREVFHQGKKVGTTRIFNDAVALRLLQFHRKSVEARRAADRTGRRSAKEVFDELAARIAEIEAEELKQPKGGDCGAA